MLLLILDYLLISNNFCLYFHPYLHCQYIFDVSWIWFKTNEMQWTLSMFAPIVAMKSDVGQNFCRPWPTHRPHSGYCSLSHHMNYLCWNALIHKKIRRNAKRQRQWWAWILSFESKQYIVPVGIPERKAAVLAAFLVQLNYKVNHPYHQYRHLYCHLNRHHH